MTTSRHGCSAGLQSCLDQTACRSKDLRYTFTKTSLFVLRARGELHLEGDRVGDGEKGRKVDRPDAEVAQQEPCRRHACQRGAGQPRLDVEDLSLCDFPNGQVAGQLETQLATGGIRGRAAVDRGRSERRHRVLVEARTVVSNLTQVIVAFLLIALERVQAHRKGIVAG